mmetsp:Transcript_41777/g.63797  ORF Transcript_41777/g.63797 Transcript_41777/m.63797 type:complete len:86 (+) Transcript_41777:2374-2631(+)
MGGQVTRNIGSKGKSNSHALKQSDEKTPAKSPQPELSSGQKRLAMSYFNTRNNVSKKAIAHCNSKQSIDQEPPLDKFPDTTTTVK